MAGALRHSFRLLAIARILARHDALFILDLLGPKPRSAQLALALLKLSVRRQTSDARPGQRLAAALQAMGPTFIKAGQALSTRPDLVGEELALDLAALQDRLPPFPGTAARQTIEEQLGKPIGQLFARFEDEAVAAASIAQVHFAETIDGQPVAVKVLRPGIEQSFQRDLASFRWAAAKLERFEPGLRRLRPTAVIDTFAQTVAMELDLRYEGAAASELRQNSAQDPYYSVPAVIWPLTARRVLTLERVYGIPVGDRPALVAAGVDLPALAAHLVQTFLSQALVHGFFHGDLHHGNLFASPDGRLIAVDFGIMGRLDTETRRTMAEILYGFLERDYERVADAHFRAGYVPASQSRAKFAQALRAIGEPIADRPLRDISLGNLLAQLLKTTETFAMQTQPQLLLLQKTMVMVEGVASQLDPEINMWEASRPVIEKWIKDNLSPAARLKTLGEAALHAAERLPAALANLDAVLEESRAAGFKLSPETLAQLRTVSPNPSPWRPMIYGFLGGLIAVMAAVALLLR
ncbi:MAG: 2-polyprenylphenol 6-hydroxylase [Sphingomonadales bacterium]|nr:2-polyprenylphenol 6-hydroxylase [Sphingomonadales bacterium]